MEVNPDKFHLLTGSNDEWKICINDDITNSNKCEKLLGVKIDSKLNFNTRISVVCKKKKRKISALTRITPFMELLLNSFYPFNNSFAEETGHNECIFHVTD